MHKTLLFALIALLVFSRAPAKADDGPTPAEIAAAKAAIVSADGLADLFDQTCIAYAGRMPQLKVWLDAHMTQAKEGQSKYFLNGMQGKVWLKQDKIGNYAIVISDAYGLCNVKVEKGPVGEVATYFKTTAAPKLKLTLKQMGDSAEGSFMGVTGRVVTYGLQIAGVDYIVILVGRDKANIPLQSQMSLAVQGPSDAPK